MLFTTKQPRKLSEAHFQQTASRFYEPKFWHHFLFWSVYFIFNTLRWGSYFEDYDYSFKTNILSFSIHISLAYINAYFLMPKYLFKKQYWRYTFAVLGLLLVALFLRFYATYYLVSTNVWPEGPETINHITLNYAVQMMLGELYVMAFFTAIKTTIDWMRERNDRHQLEKRQLATELKFLKSQVSPHFFFNTLNNIYALSLERSEKAPELILKMSSMMRYLLYTDDGPSQALAAEIEHIKNYVEIERVRCDESLVVDFHIQGNLEGARIAPMLLIPLVENAFKHGTLPIKGNASITLSFRVVTDMLHFELTNTLSAGATKDLHGAGGIGLENVRKRLALSYPESDFNFKTIQTEIFYKVILKLKVK